MYQWQVTVTTIGSSQPSPRQLSALADALAAGSEISSSDDELRVRLRVTASGLEGAGAQALGSLSQARSRAGLEAWQAVRILVERADQQPSSEMVPELMGVAEIARLLGVTRQRASKLAQSDRFPPPAAKVSAGPLWTASAVNRFVAGWTRRRGRAGPES